MSWAEKARGRLSVEHYSDDDDNKNNNDGPNTFTMINMRADEDDDKKKGLRQEIVWVPFRNLPVDAWDVILSFLNFREVQLVSNTCRFLWLLLHTRDNIWRVQLQYFRNDMEDLRGNGRLLCTELVTPLSSTAYERMKLERKLYALDARREWHFRELENGNKRGKVFSCPLTLIDDYNNGENKGLGNGGRGEEEATPLLQIRLLRPVLRDLVETSFSTVDGAADAIRTPSEYLTLCDNVNHGDFTGSRTVVQDCTAEEDGLMLFALLQTLRLAKRRPSRRLSMDEPRTSHHLMLRHFGGTLLVMCRFEAEQILQSVLGLHGILDEFVIYSNPSRCGPHFLGDSVCLPYTRYFIAPELYHHGRVGLVIVDPVRLLVVVGKECVTRDDPEWGEEYREAVEEGRPLRGSGMNPQQPRRM